jgi:hypothetical protein
MSGPTLIAATIQIRRLCARPFTPHESFSRIRHAETGREQLLPFRNTSQESCGKLVKRKILLPPCDSTELI